MAGRLPLHAGRQLRINSPFPLSSRVVQIVLRSAPYTELPFRCEVDVVVELVKGRAGAATQTHPTPRPPPLPGPSASPPCHCRSLCGWAIGGGGGASRLSRLRGWLQERWAKGGDAEELNCSHCAQRWKRSRHSVRPGG